MAKVRYLWWWWRGGRFFVHGDAGYANPFILIFGSYLYIFYFFLFFFLLIWAEFGLEYVFLLPGFVFSAFRFMGFESLRWKFCGFRLLSFLSYYKLITFMVYYESSADSLCSRLETYFVHYFSIDLQFHWTVIFSCCVLIYPNLFFFFFLNSFWEDASLLPGF